MFPYFEIQNVDDVFRISSTPSTLWILKTRENVIFYSKVTNLLARVGQTTQKNLKKEMKRKTNAD